MEFFKEKPQKAVFYLGLILVGLFTLTAFLAAFLVKKADAVEKDVYAIVGGEKITKADFDRYVYSLEFEGSPTNPRKTSEEEKSSLLSELIENKLAKIEAAEAGITVSDEEVTASITKSGVDFAGFTESQKAIARDNHRASLLKERVFESQVGYKEGNYILYRFDKYFNYGEQKFAGQDDIQKISTQQLYARQMAENTYSKLAAGTMNFEQAKSELAKDSQISSKAFAPLTLNFYGVIDKTWFTEDQSAFDSSVYQNFFEGFENTKKGEYSRPYLLKNKVKGQFKDIAYVVVQVTEEKVAPFKSKSKWYEAKEKENNVTIYYDNVGIKKPVASSLIKSLVKSLVQTANAACTVSFSGSERVAVTTLSRIERVDGTIGRYGYNKVKLFGGPVGTNGLAKYYSSCGYDTHIREYEKTADENGDLNFYTVEAGQTGNPVLIDCSKTSTGKVFFRNDPVPANTVPTSFSWTNDSTHVASKGWIQSTSIDNSSYGFWINLDLGTSSNWANGTHLWYVATFHPTYKKHLTVDVGTLDASGNFLSNKTVGKVTSAGGGINCGMGYVNCEEYYAPNSTQSTSLTETPATDYEFVKWIYSGAGSAGQTSTTKPTKGFGQGYDWDVKAVFQPAGGTPPPGGSAACNSCTVTPNTGIAPLVVRVDVNATGTSGNWTYSFTRTGQAAITGIGPIPYFTTLPTAGSYVVTATNGSASCTCTPNPVTVANPDDGGGTEVAP